MKLYRTVYFKSNYRNSTFFLKKNSLLLNSQILKLETLKRVFKHKVSVHKIEKKFLELKVILSIIYHYNFFDKTILFIGVPNKVTTTLKKQNNPHLFLPSKLSLKGVFNNKNFAKKYLSCQKIKKMNRTVLKKVPKLIISLNSSVNRFVLNEVNKLRIPIINLTDTNNNKKYFYINFFMFKNIPKIGEL